MWLTGFRVYRVNKVARVDIGLIIGWAVFIESRVSWYFWAVQRRISKQLVSVSFLVCYHTIVVLESSHFSSEFGEQTGLGRHSRRFQTELVLMIDLWRQF